VASRLPFPYCRQEPDPFRWGASRASDGFYLASADESSRSVNGLFRTWTISEGWDSPAVPKATSLTELEGQVLTSHLAISALDR
jgi:hypothetical protein